VADVPTGRRIKPLKRGRRGETRGGVLQAGPSMIRETAVRPKGRIDRRPKLVGRPAEAVPRGDVRRCRTRFVRAIDCSPIRQSHEGRHRREAGDSGRVKL
jgi:hypothetical protein